jgi:hypothetical protein
MTAYCELVRAMRGTGAGRPRASLSLMIEMLNTKSDRPHDAGIPDA